MSNEYFTSASVPVNGAPGTAAIIRQEFAQIEASFNKLPVLAGNAGEVVRVNLTGTALESSGMAISDFVTLAASETLTNKIINWADNTISTIPIAGGGTGATTLAGAQTALGIDLKANATNAVLSGVPVAETAPLGTATTRLATTAFVADSLATLVIAAGGALPGSATPLSDSGAGVVGTALAVSHEDHRHPVDTSRMAVAGGTFTGNVAGLTQLTADDSTMFATTAWVRDAFPTIAVPTSQVTGLDTALGLKAPLASPALTGNPTAPTQAAIDSSTKLATTEYVTVAVSTATAGSVGVTTGVTPIMDSVGTIGVSADAARADHIHPSDTTKQNTITGAATTIDTEDLTINRALTSNASGKVAVSAVTTTELGYLAGVTSAIQTQLGNKQGLDADLTTIAALSSADGNFIVGSPGGWVAESGAIARASLSIVTASSSAEGLVEFSDNTEASIGTATTRAMTPATTEYALRYLNVKSSETVAASGSTVDFTGIPSWAKRITLTFSAISFVAAGTARIRVGSAPTVETTGYLGAVISSSATPTIAITALSSAPQGLGALGGTYAATTTYGACVLTRHSGGNNTWSAITTLYRITDGATQNSVGEITLGASLDMISLVATTGTFDGGTVSIFWE